MNRDWDEPTRLHPAADLAAKASQDVEEPEASEGNEGCTVLENRESLLARVAASVTVSEGGGDSRLAMPESLRKAISALPAGLPGALPGAIPRAPTPAPVAEAPAAVGPRSSRGFYAHEIVEGQQDSTPMPIGDRGAEARDLAAETGARKNREARARRRWRSLVARTGPFGMVAVVGFSMGLYLREAPRTSGQSTRPDVMRIQPLAAPAAGMNITPTTRPTPGRPQQAAAARVRPMPAPQPAPQAQGAADGEPAVGLGVVRITTVPPGAAVSMDGELLKGNAPHILRLEPGRKLQLGAKLAGWQPATQELVVAEGDNALEIKLGKLTPAAKK